MPKLNITSLLVVFLFANMVLGQAFAPAKSAWLAQGEELCEEALSKHKDDASGDASADAGAALPPLGHASAARLVRAAAPTALLPAAHSAERAQHRPRSPPMHG